MKRWKIRSDDESVEQTRRGKQSKFQWFYKSKSWKVARNKCLQKNPICEICIQTGKTTAAITVNHIEPLRKIIMSGAQSISEMTWSELKKSTSQDNLESLCLECHGIEESEMIKREKNQERKELNKQKHIQRTKNKEQIKKEKRNWHTTRDKFTYKICIDKNGDPVHMDIY